MRIIVAGQFVALAPRKRPCLFSRTSTDRQPARPVRADRRPDARWTFVGRLPPMVALGALLGPDRPNGPGLADELLELQL